MSLSVAMRCRTNYYGINCGKICVPQNDCDGHYDCDHKTGDKICLNGFYEPSTNCLKRNESINLCSDSKLNNKRRIKFNWINNTYFKNIFQDTVCNNGGYCYPITISSLTIPVCCCTRGIFFRNNLKAFE